MLFASIPALLSKRSENQRSGVRHVLSGLSCLGGGVFLATCFLHLIPEAIENMDDAIASSSIKTNGFPLAYALIIVGFLLVLISEQIIQKFNKGGLSLGHSHGPSRDNKSGAPVPDYGAIRRNAALGLGFPDENGDAERSAGTSLEDSDDEDRMTTVSMHGDPGSHKPFRAIVLVFALSLHSFFEGLAIGLQPSTADILQLLGAIVVHKSVISVTLGTNLVSTTTLKSCGLFSAIAVFSGMAPAGILATLLLNGAPPLVSGVLQCIAGGTFVYITFFEILPHELNSESTEGSRLFKTMMLLTGIGLIVALMIAFPEDPDQVPSPNNVSMTVPYVFSAAQG
ncbi:zinc transporter ZIP1-like [Galendromus occidentalis]|uniref:Zinc transporter ZIP1-like n=1 Tax=Galendromus occidentalis TaxID=34638 RepID=A0AAJ6QUK2_9ACAR|nr:zinc transporter ZIP1-like [Galendromus occidentalis]